MKSRQTTQHVSGVVELIRIRIYLPSIGENSLPEPHAKHLAGCGQAAIVTIHQVVAKHQPEVAGMTQHEPDKGKADVAYIHDSIGRMSCLFDRERSLS